MALKPQFGWSGLGFLSLIVAYVTLPMIATFLYSLATVWTTNPLPEGYTIAHWIKSMHDSRFTAVLLRTIMLAVVVALVTVILALPAIYWQRVVNPAIKNVLQVVAAIPFALPILVIALGLLQFTGDYFPSLQGTIGLLMFSHVAIAFPFVYWTLDNAMAAARVEQLTEAASCCGANTGQAIGHVILPNVTAGIATALIMAFGTSFNEIALAQMLVGTRFETAQLYLLNMLKGADADYNLLAVMTIINFVVTLVLSVAVIWLNGNAMTDGKISK